MKAEWIDIEQELPKTDTYVLVSFDNYSLADIARYEEDEEGGAFYPGDEEKSYASFGLFVNAWMPFLLWFITIEYRWRVPNCDYPKGDIYTD